ncbi:MAG: sensor domain-containing diguanylate cyclase [Paenibacillus sp.]|uniref:sensor domain-containing diguanylate cyclase n=1 Tax=Paenibacillus sp. TaxID=58172 RepID=UPI00290DA591|nr:sensor domain-containing diguanylate cyclase [Paenibacillus sp.]MDU4695744.1 sensor domain-containing diguanylate cyclase [Paenibacillus sp.]
MHGNYKVASQVLDIPSSSKQRKLAFLLGSVITAASLSALPFGMTALPAMEPFLSAAIGWLIFGDMLTAFIIYSQYRASGLPGLMVLSCTYLFSGLMKFLHVLTFPDLFGEFGVFIGAGGQTAGWLWVFWHGGFSLGILVYAWVNRKWSKPFESKEQVFKFGTAGITLTLLTVLGVFELAALGERWLPNIIDQSDYREVNTSGIGPLLWILNFFALLALWGRVKGWSMMHLWLAVALLALMMDVTLTLFAGMRFTLGWYVAKLNSVVASTVVICAVVNEVNRLFIRLSEQHRQLVESGQQLEHANEQLIRLTNLDGLTEIPNRRRFDEILAWELESPEERSTALSLLIIDIDCFKAYNDYYGHQGGDHVLKEIAWTIYAEAKKEQGFAARYGGEEFVVVLSGLETQQTLEFSERLRQAVATLSIEHLRSKAEPHVTISVGGYRLAPFDPMSGEELILRADRCLYRAKEEGRNRSVVEG